MKEGDIAQQKMDAEHYQDDAYNEGSGTTVAVGLHAGDRRRILILSYPNSSGRFRRPVRDNDHSHYIGNKRGAAREEEKNRYKTYQYRIYLKIFSNSATNAGDYPVFLTSIELFHLSLRISPFLFIRITK